jgi:hypothetical protein
MAKGNMLEGMTDRCPAPPTEKPKGGSVDSDATRSGTAKTPKSLGPRTA